VISGCMPRAEMGSVGEDGAFLGTLRAASLMSRTELVECRTERQATQDYQEKQGS
jgi:hypothetical protein